MSSLTKKCSFWLVLVAHMLLLSGCGGGSGGGGGKSDAPVDPSASYKGSTAQAQVTPANAEDLALGGFGGSIVNSTVRVNRPAGEGVVTNNEPSNLLRSLTAEIKSSLRRLDATGVAKQIRKTRREAGPAKTTQRVQSFLSNGLNGGVASYTIDINDATGSFAGTVTFQGYDNNQVPIDGSADIKGTFDANFQAISRITISFTKLTLTSATYRITLAGSLSWAYNLSAASDTLSINTVLTDLSNNKTYWFKNYEISTNYGSTSLTQTMSGRYYDPDHGFIDLSTPVPLVAAYGTSWPSQGIVRFSGQSGTWLQISFHSRDLIIDADTTGGGTSTWQKMRPTNSQQEVNIQPMAVAGPDQNATQWDLVTLSGTASYDPDGDPLSYAWSFSSCPQGTCPSITGSNTATPSFIPNQPGTYTLNLTVFDGMAASVPNSVNIVVAPAVPSSPGLLQQQWQFGTFGQSIGKAGLHTTDVDSDGAPEIVASASAGGYGDNNFWYILKRNSSGAYDQIWRSEVYPVTLVRLTLADINGDGKDELVAALADGTIHAYDRVTRKELRTYNVASPLTDMVISDLDADGTMEIITSDGTGVFVTSASTGGLKWSLPNGGGSSIAVGTVDSDSALEIVTTSYGGKGYVIDGATHAIEWEYINSFGAQVRLGDLDGDGMQEIVGVSSWYKITIFNVDLKSSIWEITTNQDIDSLLVADSDGDGTPEIIYGDGQWGKVHAVDARTGLERWSVSNPEHGVSGIAVGDADLDGKKEVLWGAGGTSGGADRLCIAAPDTGTIVWQSQDILGMNPVDVGDLDGDGQDELLMVTQMSDSGYAEGVVHIFDTRTHALKFSKRLGTSDLMGTARTVRIGDVDGDGRNEYVVTTANFYDGVIQVYDGTTHVLKSQSAGYSSNYFSTLAIGDVDGDGSVEIVAGQRSSLNDATGVHLVVFNGVTLKEKWRSVLGGGWGVVLDVKLIDFDGDGHQEIIVSVNSSVTGPWLMIYDGVTHVLKHSIANQVGPIEVADIDGDGAFDLLVGSSSGIIDAFDGKSFARKLSVSSGTMYAVNALRLSDLDGDGAAEWLIGSGSNLTVLDGVNRKLKWRSTGLANNVGYRNHLAVKDVDGDARKDVFFGSDLVLHHYE